MKSYQIIISIVVLSCSLLITGGCKKALDVAPSGRLTLKDVLNNYNETEGLLTAAYSQFITHDDNLYWFQTLEDLTDNAFEAREDLGACYWWRTGQLSVTNQVTNPSTGASGSPGNDWWNIFWKGIRLANIAIQDIPQSPQVSDLEKKQWVAQARLLRAYYYFQLLEFYGPMPFIDKPFDVNFTGWDNLKRPTYNEITQRIAAECDTIIQSKILPITQPANQLGLLSAGFAYALKSRVLLYNASPLNNPDNDSKKWQEAASAAKDLINLNVYQLIDMDHYNDLWTAPYGTIVPGIIYRCPSDQSELMDLNGVPLGSYGLYNCYKGGQMPTQELVDCFEMKNGALPVAYTDGTHLQIKINPAAAEDGYSESVGGNPYENRDARFYKDILYNGADYGVPTGVDFHAIINTYIGGAQHFTSDVASGDEKYTTTGYYSRKAHDVRWYGTNGGGNGIHSYKVVFRIAEAYLNYAEAECELGNLDQAKWALNMIRTRALQPKIEDVPDFVNTQSFLLNRIRNERRVEFCLEGYRFFDVRRWDILNQTGQVITGMMISKVSDTTFEYQRVTTYKNLSYSDKYLVLPIPQDEAKKIPGILEPVPWR
ncbi:MAG: RagB/SusD family nutrient uptake outer membrane protein [Chitinophagaceae bacterium]|nr:MAG: RagB/SusD family nutrient uptake outer membrane protein [Chitinophagaceae bacterium]